MCDKFIFFNEYTCKGGEIKIKQIEVEPNDYFAIERTGNIWKLYKIDKVYIYLGDLTDYDMYRFYHWAMAGNKIININSGDENIDLIKEVYNLSQKSIEDFMLGQ